MAIRTIDLDNQRVQQELRKKIYELYPDVSPFIQILNKLGKEKVNHYKFEWYEDTGMVDTWDMIDTSGGTSPVSATSTTIKVQNAAKFLVDDIVYVPSSGEEMLVTAVDTANNQITVIRGYAGTTAADYNADTNIVIIGSARPEAYSLRGSRYTQPVPKYNYIQIFEHDVTMTAIANALNMKVGNTKELQRIWAQAVKQHKLELEKSFLFGERSMDTSGAYPRWTTRGVVKWIEEGGNVVDLSGVGGQLTRSKFEEALRMAFQYGSNRKIIFANGLLLEALARWKENSNIYRIVKDDETFGLRVTRYEHYLGTVDIVQHKLLTKDLAQFILILDIGDNKADKPFIMRYLEGFDTSIKLNVQNKEEYMLKKHVIHTVAGLEARLPERHCLIKGFTSYDPDPAN